MPRQWYSVNDRRKNFMINHNEWLASLGIKPRLLNSQSNTLPIELTGQDFHIIYRSEGIYSNNQALKKCCLSFQIVVLLNSSNTCFCCFFYFFIIYYCIMGCKNLSYSVHCICWFIFTWIYFELCIYMLRNDICYLFVNNLEYLNCKYCKCIKYCKINVY